jgi:hypothetical protein
MVKWRIYGVRYDGVPIKVYGEYSSLRRARAEMERIGAMLDYTDIDKDIVELWIKEVYEEPE